MDYFKKTYINLHRWTSYYYQISTISNIVDGLGEETKISILEIGIEKKITNACLAWLFESYGANVVIRTLDIDPSLKPDIIADVRCLPFNSDSFNSVLAFEVLEHLPFNDAILSLKEIKRVAKNYIILSLPHASLGFSLAVKLPKFLSLRTFSIFVIFPYHGEIIKFIIGR